MCVCHGSAADWLADWLMRTAPLQDPGFERQRHLGHDPRCELKLAVKSNVSLCMSRAVLGRARRDIPTYSPALCTLCSHSFTL